MILILGAHGMLGTSLMVELDHYKIKYVGLSHQALNISNEISVYKTIKDLRPKVVINCVAYTNVDKCEDHPEIAYQVNGIAVENVAKLCKKYGIKFIQISTDYVFDGSKKGAYTELDEPSPIQVYGKSKLLGEQNALKYEAFVFRVQAIYGPTKANTTHWMVSSIFENKLVPLSRDQIASPASTIWLAKEILLLSDKLTTPGIYHLSHDNYATRYEIGQFLVEGYGGEPKNLQPMEGANFGVAKRPISTILCNDKLKQTLGLQTLGTWEKDMIYYCRHIWRKPFFGSC